MLKINKRSRVVAEEELDTQVGGEAVVEPEASDLLFEAEDVAELVAEITGEDVEVTADEDSVVFAVGDDEYTVEAEGDEEVLEAVRRPLKDKKAVKASCKPVQATRQATRQGRVVRRRPVSSK